MYMLLSKDEGANILLQMQILGNNASAKWGEIKYPENVYKLGTYKY